MCVKVVVRDGEELFRALRRFRLLVDRAHGRPWTKRRFGYYEKPSALRRKRARMEWRQRHVGGKLKLHVKLAAQFSRTGPNNALGR
jgi:ribosomal protein S21